MRATHGSHHPVLSADRRARRRGDLPVLAARAVAPGRPARAGGRWSGPIAIGDADRGARRLRLRPAPPAPGPRPGLAHAFVFWGFIVLLATTGNYITNGLVETILGWPLGGFFWSVVVFFANVFVGAGARIGHLLRRPAHDRPAGAPGADARRVRHPGPDLLHRADRVDRRRVRLRRRARPPRATWADPGRAAERGAGADRDRGGADRLRR